MAGNAKDCIFKHCIVIIWFIIFCAAYTVGLFAFYKIKVNFIEREKQNVIDWATDRTKFIVDKVNEVNKESAFLNDVVKRLIDQKRHNDKMYEEVSQIHLDNTILLENNRETLKENKFQLHNIRESYIYTYQHYKSMSEVLRNLLIFDDGESPLFGHIRSALHTVHSSLNETGTRFQRYFRMTPEQYVNRKVSLTGKRPNGTDYVSDSSAS